MTTETTNTLEPTESQKCYCPVNDDVTGKDTNPFYGSTSTDDKLTIIDDLIRRAKSAGLDDNDIKNLLTLLTNESF